MHRCCSIISHKLQSLYAIFWGNFFSPKTVVNFKFVPNSTSAHVIFPRDFWVSQLTHLSNSDQRDAWDKAITPPKTPKFRSFRDFVTPALNLRILRLEINWFRPWLEIGKLALTNWRFWQSEFFLAVTQDWSSDITPHIRKQLNWHSPFSNFLRGSPRFQSHLKPTMVTIVNVSRN